LQALDNDFANCGEVFGGEGEDEVVIKKHLG
jgi:hypothetical protein